MTSMKMADDTGTMWTRALEQYMTGLDVQARKRITSTGSLEALLSDVGVLRAQYAKKTWARIFDRLNPMLQSLNGFNQCVQTFTQIAPKGFVLLWGSLSFILEVSITTVAKFWAGFPQQKMITSHLRVQFVMAKALSSS